MGICSRVEWMFDQEEFLERLGHDYELSADVARLFLDDCPRRLAAIQDAVQRRDLDALNLEAHGLKGAAGNMSAHQLAALAFELEERARAGQVDAAVFTASRLAGEVDAVLEAVRAFESLAATAPASAASTSALRAAADEPPRRRDTR